MRRTALFLVVMATVAGVSLAGDNPIVGTWESANGRSIKIYTETHFTVVGQNEDGTFSHAFAGEIVLKGNTVTERIQKGSAPDVVGQEVTHEFSISGDDWESTITYPDGTTNKEVWKRVK
jgi:hypothetical protein